jgi:uncharacterized protein YbjT (DUF2867 family)
VVQGDLDDPESLKQAMAGCYGVFGATNFCASFEQEYRQGRNLIDAVQQCGIQHFVISVLPNRHALGQGTYSRQRDDLKNALGAYAKSLNLPATFVHTAFYYEDFVHLFPVEKDIDAYYAFGPPPIDAKLAMMSVTDLGAVIATIFDHPEAYIGRVVGVAGEDRTWTEYVAIMRKVLGAEFYYNKTGADGLRVARMLEVQRLHIPNQLVHVIESYALNPDMQSFENWLISNRDQIQFASAEVFQLEAA